MLHSGTTCFIMVFMKQYGLALMVVVVLAIILIAFLIKANKRHRKSLQQQLDHEGASLYIRSGRDAEEPEVDNE